MARGAHRPLPRAAPPRTRPTFDDEPGDLPCPLALIACDHIHVDPVGLTESLLGVFVHRRAESFPTEIPLHLYFRFTNARTGPVPVRLRLVAPGDRGEVLLDVGHEMDCPGGLDVREFMVAAKVKFPAPGTYILEASAEGEVLMERALFLHPDRLHVAAGAG